MTAFRKIPARSLIFSFLLLYAATTDFIATSVLFVNGHDCDHPWVRVEHKCVERSARVKQDDERPVRKAVAKAAVRRDHAFNVLASYLDGRGTANTHLSGSPESAAPHHGSSPSSGPLLC